jgi:peroxiredoxin (alkyl hydroperoxide reductase subunit C)
MPHLGNFTTGDSEFPFENYKNRTMKKIAFVLVIFVLSSATVFSQSTKIPLIGSTAPSFTAETTNGTLNFPSDFGKKWKILFSHPQDFTPVCSSELSELARVQSDFKQLNAEIAVVSSDNIAEHKRWKTWLEGLDYKGQGSAKIDFPLIDDHSHEIAKKYGMIHEPVSSNKDIRGVYIIDPKNVVRSINFYPMQVGRNMKEITRILTALQTVDNEMVCTPANWQKGEDVIVPHYPYTDSELAQNPEIKENYYNLGGYVWYKKVK